MKIELVEKGKQCKQWPDESIQSKRQLEAKCLELAKKKNELVVKGQNELQHSKEMQKKDVEWRKRMLVMRMRTSLYDLKKSLFWAWLRYAKNVKAANYRWASHLEAGQTLGK